jgi:hypothetical protein
VPDEVAELILSIDTNNERIHDDFAEAAIEMPGLLASQVAKRELRWLRRQPRVYFGLPRKRAALVCHLVNEGEARAGFALATELLRVTRVPADIRLMPQWKGRDSDWSYKQMLDKVIPVPLAADASPRSASDASSAGARFRAAAIAPGATASSAAALG